MKKINLLSTGVLVNDPMIEYASSHMCGSNIHKCFDASWTIVTHSQERAEKAVQQAEKAPLDVQILVDASSREDRDASTCRALSTIPEGELVWMIPEGAMVEPFAGTEIMNLVNKSDRPIAIEKNICRGYDHLIFKVPSHKHISTPKKMLKFILSLREEAEDIPVQNIYTSRGASNDMEKLCIMYWNLKFWQHRYTEHYHKIFEPIRKDAKAILEVGIAFGGSLRTWRDYFHKAEIFGIDIYPESAIKEHRIHGIHADSRSSDTVQALKKICPIQFDMINDDGDHSPSAQIDTMKLMWELLAPGGIYVIEDIWGVDDLKKGILKNFPKAELELIDLRPKSGYGDSVIITVKKS